jgi:hypothetical protein
MRPEPRLPGDPPPWLLVAAVAIILAIGVFLLIAPLTCPGVLTR